MCFEVLIKIDFELIKCLIIASPGFVKDDFFKFIKENFQKVEYLQLNKKHNIISKILLAKSSSGYLNSLNEILTVPAIESRLKDTKAVKEIKVLDEFYFVFKYCI